MNIYTKSWNMNIAIVTMMDTIHIITRAKVMRSILTGMFTKQ
ncbi:MAG: hypothetical protein ACOY3J_07715 [Bacillota bacterium]